MIFHPDVPYHTFRRQSKCRELLTQRGSKLGKIADYSLYFEEVPKTDRYFDTTKSSRHETKFYSKASTFCQEKLEARAENEDEKKKKYRKTLNVSINKR